jgi:glutamate synthase (NADPH/NADH) large chain
MFFLPQNNLNRRAAVRMFEIVAKNNGVEVLGWRDVPVHPEVLGEKARRCMPHISQCFVARPEGTERGLPFDRKLYVVRREFEQGAVRDKNTGETYDGSYVCSLSSRTIVYKGMFLVKQLRAFYGDLQSHDYKTAIAMVHSRFSTNTTPSWEKAHPYRYIAHNGEINTIRGNIDRMLAREETMSSDLLRNSYDKIYPVVDTGGSDSSILDNSLEFLYMNGIDLPLAVMIMMPEPWKNDMDMQQKRKDFYHYYATMMEPWDGPAAVIFSDGEILGATLDRNGLRPSRYYVTDDGRLIISSEVGVLDIPPEHVVTKSRLQPGRILLVDTKKKRIITDEECKNYYAERAPYGEWLDQYLLHLGNLKIPNKKVPSYGSERRARLYKAFGYTYEDVSGTILPMALNGIEPTASMGHDTPLAVLSEKHQSLFDYFKQMFAQVTNPPIDSLREKIVTDTTVYIGSDGNLLDDKPDNCSVLEINNPILTGVDLLGIKALDRPHFKTKTVSILYYRNTPLDRVLEQLNVAVDRACSEGANIIVLSDRGVDENHLPVPSLLAVSSVEQHLVRTRKRTKVSLIIESGEPRDVHQCACLLGFGARAIHPYLAHECISESVANGTLDKDEHTAIDDYNKALLNGILKIAAKMGISTLQSYQSARIFEAIGIKQEVIDRYFTGTVSRVGGIGLKEIGDDVAFRHDHAFDPLGLGIDLNVESAGKHRLRSGSSKEDHLWNPETIITLQRSVRNKDYEEFCKYTDLVDNERPHTLRGLMAFSPQNDPVPLDEVEPASEIVKRFKTGAMSYGSLSKEAHETLAIAMNRLGGKSNTGEGGEDRSRFGTEKNSKIKQVASGRFGVTEEYLLSAEEIQIKMAQGAKPGEGGHLPGNKVYPWITKVRFSTPGITLISPPPHHDIYSIEDLAQLIYDLKNANRNARIAVKLVSEAGVGTVASGVAKAGAGVILISGYDGGTGAAPSSSIHNAGLPWELGIAEAQRALTANGLRGRVRLETDGKLMSGRDVAIAALLGAEEFSFATAPLITMGCMMMRVCSQDICPFGIATQNETLRKRFRGKPEYVMNFMTFIAEQLRRIMATLGFRTVDEMIGRTDCLKPKEHQITRRAEMVTLENILHSGKNGSEGTDKHFNSDKAYDFHLEKTIDESVILPYFENELKKKNPKKKELSIKVSSTDRTVGTIFGSEVQRNFGSSLKDDTFVIHTEGGCGQSFGAFLPKGVTFDIQGDANDGFGKGLSGGKLIIRPPESSRFRSEDNIIVGNVALYGATSGTVYVRGVAGERFCVRNSGAIAVAEGCGNHGLEYMTGGRAVILGPTGRNFAAGMSGGIAYVLDTGHTLYRRMNHSMATAEPLTDPGDISELKGILKDFRDATGSELADSILKDFSRYQGDFKKIIPEEYRTMLNVIHRYEAKGLSEEQALMEAFNEIARR